jgi:hypothetical protein
MLISIYENTEIRSLHYANITRTKTKKKLCNREGDCFVSNDSAVEFAVK